MKLICLNLVVLILSNPFLLQVFIAIGKKKNSPHKFKKIIIRFNIYCDTLHSYYFERELARKQSLESKIDEAWEKAIKYLSINEKNLEDQKNFQEFFRRRRYDIATINYHFIDKNEKELEIEENTNYFSDIAFTGHSLLTLKNYQELIMNSWIKSQTVDFIPIFYGNAEKQEIPVSYWTKKLCSRYFIEKYFDKVVFNPMVILLKKWYSMTEKGKYIKNINQNLMYLINNIQTNVLNLGIQLKKFDEEIPYDVSIGQYFSRKEIFLINHYSKKAWSFFERHLKKIWFFQIRMLQYKCSVIFKEKILKLFLQEPLHWDTGNNKAIKECEELFMKSGADFEIPLIKKTLYFAKNELINALRDYFIELKESPAKELNALDKIEKNINRTKSKSKQMIVGFALTTAVRLPGYGNFQMVSSYAYGPHVFNFSCINDKSTLENETKGYVKPVRIQPSLNFDIRL
uniref:Uncharacterized protein n=1 Tax=Hemiselmis andersenii TaxID=464988 RepID=A0A6U2BZM7_HEMAN|mmetsp:Transcript_18349/g.42484  ORF Transcript_18349/g.42484 Transcript_18349/m.42484 type:complete len:458 (+) Transcript_18349:3408-4781(+)